MSFLKRLVAVIIGLFISFILFADEGMWLFNNIPQKLIREKYGFAPDDAFLTHVRLSAVRIGASGSFVSRDGIVMTNHHVALSQLQKMSTPEHNYVMTGFYAKNQSEEMKCPDEEVEILMGIEDVTARVENAVKKEANFEEANKERKAEIARIEQESLKKTGMKSEVVELYGGARYNLYTYKRYTDIRLVFAPEQQIAFYGGDPDNFTYPRYDLDVAFFRVYENEKPLKVKEYLQFSKGGIKDGELTFVAGHPGHTERLITLSQWDYQRDFGYPLRFSYQKNRHDVILDYMGRGPVQTQRAMSYRFFIENNLKAMQGEFEGLKDQNLRNEKEKNEKILRNKIETHPNLKEKYGTLYSDIDRAIALSREHSKELNYKQGMPGGRLTGIALNLVLYPEETAKPNEKRLPEFQDANLDEFIYYLSSPAPIYKDLEEALFIGSLKWLSSALGYDDEYLKTILQGKSLEESAGELIGGTRLDDRDFRKSLLKGGKKTIDKCNDPLILLAKRLKGTIVKNRKWYEDNIEAILTPAESKLAKARFELFGDSAYPDATGTLRLAFGKASGYDFATTKVPYKTTFYGLYDRALSFNNNGDFELPERYIERKGRIDLSTPLNFVTTCDITGGNSGSPVINKKGEVIGLVFDGNAESHVNKFIYGEEQARCVAVDIRAILMALRDLYDAKPLADELSSGR